jgi:hypothetical protein
VLIKRRKEFGCDPFKFGTIAEYIINGMLSAIRNTGFLGELSRGDWGV